MIDTFKINFSDVHITIFFYIYTIGCLDKLLIALKILHPCSDLYIFQAINYFIGTIRALKYIKNGEYLIFTNKLNLACESSLYTNIYLYLC